MIGWLPISGNERQKIINWKHKQHIFWIQKSLVHKIDYPKTPSSFWMCECWLCQHLKWVLNSKKTVKPTGNMDSDSQHNSQLFSMFGHGVLALFVCQLHLNMPNNKLLSREMIQNPSILPQIHIKASMRVPLSPLLHIGSQPKCLSFNSFLN